MGHRLATTVHRGNRPAADGLTPRSPAPNGPESETEMDASGPAGQHNAAQAQVLPEQDQLRASTKSDGGSGLSLEQWCVLKAVTDLRVEVPSR